MQAIQSRIVAVNSDMAALQIREMFPDCLDLTIREVQTGWFEFCAILSVEEVEVE